MYNVGVVEDKQALGNFFFFFLPSAVSTSGFGSGGSSSPFSPILETNLPFTLGLVSAKRFLQSYLICLRQIRFNFFSLNLSMRTSLSSLVYTPTLHPSPITIPFAGPKSDARRGILLKLIFICSPELINPVFELGAVLITSVL